MAMEPLKTGNKVADAFISPTFQLGSQDVLPFSPFRVSFQGDGHSVIGLTYFIVREREKIEKYKRFLETIFFLNTSTQHRDMATGSGICPGSLIPAALILLVRSVKVPGTHKIKSHTSGAIGESLNLWWVQPLSHRNWNTLTRLLLILFLETCTACFAAAVATLNSSEQ